jgi:hypothetical protein
MVYDFEPAIDRIRDCRGHASIPFHRCVQTFTDELRQLAN